MELSLHTSFADELREDWNHLVDQNHTRVPFLNYDYLSTWWNARGGGEWPDAQLVLVTAHESGELVAIAPLFCTNTFPGVSAQDARPRLMLLGSIEVSDYLDLIVEKGRLEEFVTLLIPFLMQADLPAWCCLDLYNLFDDSPTLAALQTTATRVGLSYAAEQVYHCPYIPLPGDWETYLASIDKKQRHEIRRKIRRLEESGVESRWYLAKDGDKLENEIADFTALMEQDAEKARFLTPAMRAFMHSVICWAHQEGILHLAFLEINGKKAAAYLAFDDLNRLWVYNSGISREFIEYSPGWVLLGYQLQWANENKREAFDFMRGDEEYKYRFGAIDRHLERVTLTR
jgi:CelD/BcsL family acetyltransferase involved in cellulose biosynthesis